jgi:replication fork clamp-binding protein CrfC
MEQLIPIINKLQDVVAVVETNPLDLPQIVVVGAQSAGKSSVLESIVGRDFLPRGSGIVTRRPLVLQLIHKKYSGSGPKEWGEFLHLPQKRFTDFNEIRREIDEDTDRVAGKNKGVVKQPINLKIYSPTVVNLTLVDLPGLTKVPVGEQPKDISIRIQEMVLEYISKPSSLILAVTPANTDIANSDALKIAQQVDPDGQRTIGVLTKLDIMDRGTDCLEALQGRTYPLRHGFIATVNRSQQDIVQNLSVEESRKQEQKYFAEHPVYKQVASHCGVNYLSNALNKLLMGHIRDCLPELRSKVNTSLTTLRSEILALGDEKISTNKGALLLNLINSFVHVYICTIDGRLSTKSSTEELYGGARINYIFNDIYSNYIDQIHALGGLTEDEIQIVMTNATGPKASLFIPEESFEQLAKCQIKILEDPSLRCADLVYDELQRIINCIEIPELKRFSNLRDKITEVANDLLRNCKKPAQDMIKSLIAVELSHINTNHPDFMRGGEAIAEILKQRAERQQAPPDPNLMPPDASPELKQQLENQRRLHEQRQREEQIKREREELRRQAQEREERERRERESNKKGFFGGFFSFWS